MHAIPNWLKYLLYYQLGSVIITGLILLVRHLILSARKQESKRRQRSLLLYLFPPKIRRKIIIRLKAREEYKKARGYHHLVQLRKARSRLEKKKYICKKKHIKLKADLNSFNREEQEEFTREVEKNIVLERFQEVNGIGPNLSSRIINGVFRGRLKDLRYAYRIHGVGETKQHSINQWIRSYENRLTEIVASDFKGKQTIVDTFDQRREETHKEIFNVKAALEFVETKLAMLEQEIQKLESVSVDDFVAAYHGEKKKTKEIDYFLKGVFGEWESMPDWYKWVMKN